MILLDTQTVIWLDDDLKRISKPALTAIRKALKEGTQLAIADITFWEIALLVSKKRVEMLRPLALTLNHLASIYEVFPISAAIAEAAAHLPVGFPKDPADRLIAATAFVHGLPLITSDAAIRASGGVSCIW